MGNLVLGSTDDDLIAKAPGIARHSHTHWWIKGAVLLTGTAQATKGLNKRRGAEALIETELVHLLGGTVARFWAALYRFTNLLRLLLSPTIRDTDGSHPHCPPSCSQYNAPRHPAPRLPDYVDSSRINIVSSSPALSMRLSSSLASDHAGYVAYELYSLSEDATVELALAFLQYALVYCPLQQHVFAAAMYPSELLLEFLGLRRRMLAMMGYGGLQFEAPADGEVVLLRRDPTGHFQGYGEVLVLLEAKKRFTLICEGRLVIMD